MTPQKFTYPFCYTPHPMVEKAAADLIRLIDGDPSMKNLFAEGKMMGVLIVAGKRHCDSPLLHKMEGAGNEDLSCLFAFSGVAGGRSIVDGFVPPVFDLQDPDGYFKKAEAEITAINARIKDLETAGNFSGAESFKAERKARSKELQEWIFKQYIVLNARGGSASILDIFARRGLVPPGGTGDCAAPKLLQYAFRNGLSPLAMGEFWYGTSPQNEIRRQGSFYPSCTGKCGPLLAFMLEGLDLEPNPLESDFAPSEVKIIYEDDDIIVADKPSGMLAVPGRTLMVSLQERLQQSAAKGVKICACHRLDMDTSGLVVFAKDTTNQVLIQRQFEQHTVHKKYTARLIPAETGQDTDIAAEGRISLPLALDYYDRPRQMVDFKDGKQAVTDYKVLRELPDGGLEVMFVPLTGRTHQLRVHAASPLGLGRPIRGDRLYGGGRGRLCLHAASLSFTHPRTGKLLEFTSEPDFKG